MQPEKGASCAASRPLMDQDDNPFARASRCQFKREPWNEEEDVVLRKLASARVTSREIALTLSRTLAAVRNRARVIGVQLTHASQIGACRRHRRASTRSRSSHLPGRTVSFSHIHSGIHQ